MLPWLSNHGILGLNARSLLYIRPFNPKKATALADSKLRTKAYLAARGIPVAKLYGRIETREQLRAFDFSQLPDECVLKPNNGFGGEGIIVLKGKNKYGEFMRNGKEPISEAELREHIEDIIDGRFSLSGRRDTAFFEQILTPHDSLMRFRPVGLPDIRVIVFNLVPVMAMLRIPTAESEGKANIHLGGLGIGIDIAKGVTTHAAQYHTIIDELPHGGIPSGHRIAHWDDILLVCSRIQQITNIGYLACDITLDKDMGPALLEVNARAGLNVQIANLAPLRSRLDRVKGIAVSSPEKGVRIGQDLFGEKRKEYRAATPEKPTLGLSEHVQIAMMDGSSLEVPCRIDSTHERTVFSQKLINELLERGGAEVKEGEEAVYKVKFTLGGKKVQTVVGMEPIAGRERAIIGTRDLAGFLIDPTKKAQETEKPRTVEKTDLRALDKMLGQMDRDLLLLKYLKPTNLQEETQRLKEDHLYNPTFTYPEIPIDTDDVMKRLTQKIKDTSPLGVLLEKKRKELSKRLTLLQARGQEEAFTNASIALFGKPNVTLLKAATRDIVQRRACDLPPRPKDLMNAEQAAKKFKEVLHSYSLHNWQVSVRPKLVADVTVGGNNIYVRAGATFSNEHLGSLIAHEIETHVLTSENGDHQPYTLLRRGCAGYIDTQEGLATYNENVILSPYAEKRYSAPRNILAIDFCLSHSLAEVRAYLQDELGFDEHQSLKKSIMMKRGFTDASTPGGFTKGIAYYRGLKAIERFVKNGGDLRRLYVGKVALDDLETIEQLPELVAPLILPEFLRE